MNILNTISVASVLVVSAAAQAGAVVNLAPSQVTDGLSGIMNTQMSELIGSAISDKYIDYSILDGGAGEGGSPLFEGTLMTRVVRSHQTGNLTFNYRILDTSSSFGSQISHIEVGGFEGFQTRVEFRNEATSPGVQGPFGAERNALGDIVDFSFQGGLAAADNSHYFFAMTDAENFFEDSALATIYLDSGESVSLVVDSATPAVPAPGAFGLLAGAGLLSTRRRR